jgi:hypothetical protein
MLVTATAWQLLRSDNSRPLAGVRQLPIRVNIRWHPRLKERMIFGSVWATEQVGRVSLRPQDGGRNCTLLGREPLPEAKAFGQMG